MKKKIIALLMAAAVTTGVGGYGTYAYFTDRDTEGTDVNITMGTVDVNAYWATGEGLTVWTPTWKGVTEVVAQDGGQTLSFENVKPGDTFERDVVIANYGTLKADMNVMLKDTITDLGVELVEVTSQTGKVAVDPAVEGRWYENGVAPYGFIRATVKVTVPENAGNDWMNKVIKLDVNELIEANAHQTIY